jgi:predicted TIM-barrel fold metal-dependent hydrolase
MTDPIIDAEVHLLHPEARQSDFMAGTNEPVRKAIHEHEDFPILEDLMGVDNLIESMEQNGIGRCIIMGLPWLDPDINAANNEFIADTVAHYPDKFRGMYIPHLEDIQQAKKEIESLDQQSFIGVKLIPTWQQMRIDDDSLEPLITAVKEQGLFLMVHTDHLTQSLDGDAPYRLLQFLRKHSDVKLLAPHLGGLLCIYALDDRIESLLENTYFITSVSSTMKMVQYAVNVNPDNVIFGTDFPFNHCHNQGSLIEELNDLSLSAEEEAKVFHETAATLFECNEW